MLTKVELAEYLKVSKRTIERAVENGMPHYKMNDRTVRFELEEVKDWMKGEK